MCIQLWFNKMSECDLGRLLRGNITLYREPTMRCFAKWCCDVRSYSGTQRVRHAAHAWGASCWRHFNRRRDLWNIICMSTRPWLERKQRDSHRQQTAEICVFLPEKQQRQTLICESRKAPDAHSDLHEKQDVQRAMQHKPILSSPATKNECYLPAGGDRARWSMGLPGSETDGLQRSVMDCMSIFRRIITHRIQIKLSQGNRLNVGNIQFARVRLDRFISRSHYMKISRLPCQTVRQRGENTPHTTVQDCFSISTKWNILMSCQDNLITQYFFKETSRYFQVRQRMRPL